MAKAALKPKSPARKAKAPAKAEQEYLAFRKTSARLIGNGSLRSLPNSLESFLAGLNREVSRGRTVTITRSHATLTTSEAAELLGVSRQFFVKILEQGEIPYHLAGSHRRVYAQDLFRYRAVRDERRHKAIGDLALAEVKEGIYDAVPYPVPLDDG